MQWYFRFFSVSVLLLKICYESNNYSYKLKVTVIITSNFHYVTVMDRPNPGNMIETMSYHLYDKVSGLRYKKIGAAIKNMSKKCIWNIEHTTFSSPPESYIHIFLLHLDNRGFYSFSAPRSANTIFLVRLKMSNEKII